MVDDKNYTPAAVLIVMMAQQKVMSGNLAIMNDVKAPAKSDLPYPRSDPLLVGVSPCVGRVRSLTVMIAWGN